ncbi:MAG: hypothetical protein ACR2RV_19580 [Verrucomicrobiales bacterium]
MSDSNLEPHPASDSLTRFREELLNETLAAVATRRRRRYGRRILVAISCCIPVIWILLVPSGEREEGLAGLPSQPRPVTAEPAAIEVTILETQPLAAGSIVRTDPGLLERYKVKGAVDEVVWANATDGELMAALDGRRVILATDLSGRSKLRLLD